MKKISKYKEQKAPSAATLAIPEFMGVRRNLLVMCVALLCVLISVTWLIVNNSQQKLIEFKSRQIANVVATQATTARSLYSRTIVAKLKADGFSASTQSDNTIGAVPIPAQFLKALAHDSSARSGGSYQFRPLSKWNLSPDQGLKDDFQRWAWSGLERQQRNESKSAVEWTPIWRIEEFDGNKALRYLVADPAASQSCVDCHNAMEQQPGIKAIRKEAGVASGKVWQLHDLMGALEVIVPVHEASLLAANQTRNGLAIILTVSIIGLILVFGVTAIDRSRSIAITRDLEYQARHDALTTLPNRSGFNQLIDPIFGSSKNENNPELHAVMLLDLDDFKRINDTLGHSTGDEVLKETARRLRSVLPPSGVIARLGGDEFAVCLPGANHEAAKQVAEKIISTLDEVFEIGEYRLQSGASIGISCVPKDGHDQDEILRCADVAMYCAKRNREGYTFYDVDNDHNHLTILSTISDFKAALENNELAMVYQPKFDLQAGVVTGVEALLRWHHPEFGMIPPTRIIPMAEQCGQIEKLTRWTLQTGLSQLKKWHEQGHELQLAVNLSAQMLNTAATADLVLECLDEANIACEHLIIEVTETAMMEDPDCAEKLLTQLNQKGVVLSVDDFGTGYSSLSYIHRLPLQELKLDRSFLSCVDGNIKNTVILKTTIELAANLNLNLVAEGVEDAETLQMLLKSQCFTVQGFYLCKPDTGQNITDKLPALQQLALTWARTGQGLSLGKAA